MVTTIARRVASADDRITRGARDNDSGAAVAPRATVSGAIEALERNCKGFRTSCNGFACGRSDNVLREEVTAVTSKLKIAVLGELIAWLQSHESRFSASQLHW